MMGYDLKCFTMLTCCLLIPGKVSANKRLSWVQLAMIENGIVPDMIPVAPKGLVKVVYPSGAKVELGKELTPTMVKDKPTVTFDADPGGLYTLSMSDLDNPSRANPLDREWQHWLVVNIPECNIGKGEVIDDFIGSGPPEKSGLHRYVFLVYKQPSRLTVTEPRHTKYFGKHRPNFNITKFAKKYCLGNPIAGNFYQAQWDDYVPQIYEQLKDM